MKINSKYVGLISGPLSFIVILLYFHPEGLNPRANAILASTIWIAIWWVTEVIPISVTALLPIILFPLTGGLGVSETTASFGHKYVFLYLGGFIIAIITIFKKHWSPYTVPLYSILEGLALGGISAIYNSMYTDIVQQAIFLVD